MMFLSRFVDICVERSRGVKERGYKVYTRKAEVQCTCDQTDY